MARSSTEQRKQKEQDVVSAENAIKEGISRGERAQISTDREMNREISDRLVGKSGWNYADREKFTRAVKDIRERLRRLLTNGKGGEKSGSRADVEARLKARTAWISEIMRENPDITRRQVLAIIRERRPNVFADLCPDGLRNAVKKAFKDYESGKDGAQAGGSSSLVLPVGNSMATLEKMGSILEEFNELVALFKRQEDERNARIAEGLARSTADLAVCKLEIADLKHARAVDRLDQAERMLEARRVDRQIIVDLRQQIEKLTITLRSDAANRTKIDPQKHFVIYSE